MNAVLKPVDLGAVGPVLGLALLSSSLLKTEPAPTDLLLMMAVGLWMISPKAKTPLPVSLVGLGLLLILSGVVPMLLPGWSGNFPGGGKAVLTNVYLVAAFLGLVSMVQTCGLQLLGLLPLFLLGALFSLVAALLAYSGLIDWPALVHFETQLKGFHQDPNVFGPYMLMAFGLCLYWISRVRGYALVWLTGLASILLVGTLLSFSRGAWLNLLVFGLGIFALGLFPRIQFLRIALMGLLLGVLALSLADNQLAQNLATKLGVGGARGEQLTALASEQFRFSVQAEAQRLSLQHPLGLGSGQSSWWLQVTPHSLYWLVLLEHGWLGFGCLMGLLLLTLTRLAAKIMLGGPARGLYVVLLALIVGTLVNSLVIDTLHWRHFWLMLALAWGSYEDRAEPAVPPQELIGAGGSA